MINPNIFREYDIRGIADTDLTDDTVEKIGKAYGTYMGRKGYKKYTVGCDVRLSSDRVKSALIRGINATGGDVIDIGVVPTPILYYSVVKFGADGGIMVTGSHNPIEFNGLKMCEGIGSVYGEQIQELRRLIEAGDFLSGNGNTRKQEIVEDYVGMIKSKIKLDKKLKIVIDAGNGTAGEIAPKLWEDMGCEVTCLFCKPDGRFPNHLPDPTVPKYVVELRKKVVEKKADLGIGYDGDSDRIGVIDNQGNIVFADRFMALFAKDVLQKNSGSSIIFDVKCSQALPEYIEKFGGKPLMWKTGHALLKAKMKETKAPFGGEMSGHIFFADDYFGFDDAIYSSGRLLQILSRTDKTMAQLVDEIPFFMGTPEIRVDCADEEKFKVVDELVKYFNQNYETIDIDGVRVLFGDGWGLVRASNTQPVLVLRFEAKTDQRLNEIMDVFKKKLREFSAVKFSEEDFEF
ncbi:phosphomannomutase [candidate division KSB1 bacterium]|nr:phosphomannomutase [candidate division KSB1 bacterium]